MLVLRDQLEFALHVWPASRYQVTLPIISVFTLPHQVCFTLTLKTAKPVNCLFYGSSDQLVRDATVKIRLEINFLHSSVNIFADTIFGNVPGTKI